GALNRDIERLLHDGDARWSTTTRDMLATATLKDVRAVWDRPLRDEPLTVSVVGDVTLDHAIDLVSRTLGALPRRTAGRVEAADA
ncbi:hypothetical protein, partial [Klebsiella pneumoniae]|uniref:hypothetical protein n=1 Tax=Klebsiella pneumoniae TaxID=573 RepID=UPI003EE0AAF8